MLGGSYSLQDHLLVSKSQLQQSQLKWYHHRLLGLAALQALQESATVGIPGRLGRT